MEGGTNPVEDSAVGSHVKESLEIPLSQASMLAETALVPRAQRGLLQSTAHAESIWTPQDLGSWGETQTGGVEFCLNF